MSQCSARRKTGSSYEVGYGRPPSHGRFRPGQSGNPQGRRRGSKDPRDLHGLVLEDARRPVQFTEGGEVVSLPAVQVGYRKLFQLAAAGDKRAMRAVVEQYEEIRAQQPARSEPSEPEGSACLPINEALETFRRSRRKRDEAA
jgi:hypothetical protein